MEIPQRATFEIVETEPVVKGQTASGSFKAGAAVERRQDDGADAYHGGHARRGDDGDGAYVERAKD